jgi:hypothetical protein
VQHALHRTSACSCCLLSHVLEGPACLDQPTHRHCQLGQNNRLQQQRRRRHIVQSFLADP